MREDVDKPRSSPRFIAPKETPRNSRLLPEEYAARAEQWQERIRKAAPANGFANAGWLERA